MATSEYQHILAPLERRTPMHDSRPGSSRQPRHARHAAAHTPAPTGAQVKVTYDGVEYAVRLDSPEGKKFLSTLAPMLAAARVSDSDQHEPRAG